MFKQHKLARLFLDDFLRHEGDGSLKDGVKRGEMEKGAMGKRTVKKGWREGEGENRGSN